MNDEVVHALIDIWLRELRQRTYKVVSLMGNPQTREVTGADGKNYQLGAEVFWDGERSGDILVIVAGDDGGWRAFRPLTRDFIMSRQGAFIGKMETP
jgi:hypothetical protein